jgi:hypothetical protein
MMEKGRNEGALGAMEKEDSGPEIGSHHDMPSAEMN